MYSVGHRFKDLKYGHAVRWNGREQNVEEVGDDYAVINGETLSAEQLNDMFKSEDMPFEIIQ